MTFLARRRRQPPWAKKSFTKEEGGFARSPPSVHNTYAYFFCELDPATTTYIMILFFNDDAAEYISSQKEDVGSPTCHSSGIFQYYYSSMGLANLKHLPITRPYYDQRRKPYEYYCDATTLKNARLFTDRPGWGSGRLQNLTGWVGFRGVRNLVSGRVGSGYEELKISWVVGRYNN